MLNINKSDLLRHHVPKGLSDRFVLTSAGLLTTAYWNLPPDAQIADMIVAMCEDEAIHRDIHHAFAER